MTISLGAQLRMIARSADGDPKSTEALGRLTKIRAETSGLSTKIGSEGDFLIDQEHRNLILDRVYASGQLLQRCRRVEMTKREMSIAVVDEKNRSEGSRFGGIRLDWRVDGELLNKTQAKFRKTTLDAQRLAGVLVATNELIADVTALEEAFLTVVALEMTHKLERELVSNANSRGLAGLLQANALITVAAETGQAANTIEPRNVVNMASRLWPGAWPNAVWLANQSTLQQLLSLDSQTTSNLVTFNSGMELLGKPLLILEQCPALGSLGDLLLIDPSAYVIGDRSFEMAVSADVDFSTSETNFRFSYRLDGQPLWHTATTPENGGAMVSPYITLAART